MNVLFQPHVIHQQGKCFLLNMHFNALLKSLFVSGVKIQMEALLAFALLVQLETRWAPVVENQATALQITIALHQQLA